MAENTKKWDETGRRYRSYIKLEKRLSENTVESYMRDYMQFAHFILRQWDVAPHDGLPAEFHRFHRQSLQAHVYGFRFPLEILLFRPLPEY